jgi:hypothetical protein
MRAREASENVRRGPVVGRLAGVGIHGDLLVVSTRSPAIDAGEATTGPIATEVRLAPLRAHQLIGQPTFPQASNPLPRE